MCHDTPTVIYTAASKSKLTLIRVLIWEEEFGKQEIAYLPARHGLKKKKKKMVILENVERIICK
jgi:hypothetical protein